MRILGYVLIFLAWLWPVYGWAETKRPLVDDILAGEGVKAAALSPNGRFVAVLSKSQLGSGLSIADLTNLNEGRRNVRLGEVQPLGVIWLDNDTLVVSIAYYVVYGRKGHVRIAADLTGDEAAAFPIFLTTIVARSSGLAIPILDGSGTAQKRFTPIGPLRFPPESKGKLITAGIKNKRIHLYSVDINTGITTRIAEGTRATKEWHLDQRGHPIFRIDEDKKDRSKKIYINTSTQLGVPEWNLHSRPNDAGGARFEVQPLGPGPEAGHYYVSARKPGSDKTNIFLYDLKMRSLGPPIAKHEKYDFIGGVFSASDGDLLSVFFDADRRYFRMLDPVYQSHIDALEDMFGEHASVRLLDWAVNRTRWLIYADGPTRPGSFHFYDPLNKELIGLGAVNRALANKTFSVTQAINYEARDGLALTGYLTRPRTIKEGVSPPLIVFPHGGPEERDRITYEPLVQLLAVQGYQVFQPNFRGSSGYGKAFADLGRRQWGKAMQWDIEDGVKALLDRGLAQADKACIAGYSYGGYAALMAAVQTPKMYRCVIGMSGVYDLRSMLKWERKKWGRNSAAMQYWQDHIGDYADKQSLAEISPRHNIDRINVPILLTHGKRDNTVPVAQSKAMAKSLRAAGKKVLYVPLETATHHIKVFEEAALEYNALLDFLAEHLPTRLNNPDLNANLYRR